MEEPLSIKSLAVGGIIVLFIGFVITLLIGLYFFEPTESTPNEVPIEEETMQGGSNTTSQGTGIRGTAMLGPTCPVESDPPDPECADKPFKTTLVALTMDGRTVKEFSTNSEGKFVLELAPGTYTIRSVVVANVLPYCAGSEPINVTRGMLTDVVISCDTGIR